MTQYELANAAFNKQKPTKADAKTLVARIAERVEDPDIVDELAALYRFFMPPTPRQPQTPFQWVAQAVARPDDSSPESMRTIQVKDGVAAATNGHHLHVADDVDMLDGYYSATGDRVADLDHHTFPQWERLLRNSPACGARPVDIGNVREHHDSTVIHVEVDGLWFNHRYITQAIGQTKTVRIEHFDNHGKIQVQGPFPGCTAIVMSALN